ncbi:unnamed protein product [Allacma fusca]|uniref:Ricin B lectin domain-containing protein n=1 Tax=Allacma fusca TaxID=39272 RepID=A0A8J2PFM2_9HEXA|nr:unnamed protein product [Allacma fusca]
MVFEKYEYFNYILTNIQSLDVRGEKCGNEVEIITFKHHGESNQCWKASLKDGGVVLSSLLQNKEDKLLQVLEENIDTGKVQTYHELNSLNQKWYLEDVNKADQTFVIKNLSSNKCLQNNGRGKQVTTAEPNNVSSRHIWKIERTDFPSQKS